MPTRNIILYGIVIALLLAARDWHCGLQTHYCADAAAASPEGRQATNEAHHVPLPAAPVTDRGGVGVSAFTDPPNEYCCCTTAAVEGNSKPLLDLLDKIVDRPYFRIFRVNVKRECSFWAVNTICSLRHNPCAVCRCNMDEVPFAFRDDGDMGVLPDDWNSAPIARRDVKALGDTSSDDPLLSAHYRHEHFLSPQSWNTGPNGGGSGGGSHNNVFGAFEDLDAEFFDLRQNPEGFTGYQGKMIWDAIYNENCFPHAAAAPTSALDHSDGGGGTCSQQHVFYQLLSGLQTSISTHLSIHRPGSTEPATTVCDELSKRVLSKPEYVRNLHILYQFVLRSVTRAAGAFLEVDVASPSSSAPAGASNTDAAVLARNRKRYLDDTELVDYLQSLFQERLLCSNTFNETKFLESPSSRELVAEMKRMVHNITKLMDCVACEKCRLWGKLQTIGLATALKILVHPSAASFDLSRAEKVSLVNLLRQLTVSVNALTTVCPLSMLSV